ncbi:MAG: glycosyltransferase family 4 protein [Alphaproteobacteria bacterium]|nr:glycosyltransferase family 4 protein [Alphaproteobacteria bacterium]
MVIDELAIRGVEIELLSGEEPPAGVGRGRLSWLRIDWARRLATAAAVARTLWSARGRRPVVAELTGPGLLAGLINRVVRADLVIHEHSDIEQLYLARGGLLGQVRRIATRIAFRGASGVAVVSPHLVDPMRRLLAPSAPRVDWVPNPVVPFLDRLSATDERSSAVRIFLIGRDAPEKRFDIALRLLDQVDMNVTIAIVSDASAARREEMRRIAGGKTIDFFSDYSEILSFDRTASILLNMSVVESYSLTIAEWLASGLPVMSARSANLIALWSAYRGCTFLDSETPDGLSAAVQACRSLAPDDRPGFQPPSVAATVDGLLAMTARA